MSEWAEYPNESECESAKDEGRKATSALANPYWLEYPNPSRKGLKDEVLARLWVDGYCSKAMA